MIRTMFSARSPQTRIFLFYWTTISCVAVLPVGHAPTEAEFVVRAVQYVGGRHGMDIFPYVELSIIKEF